MVEPLRILILEDVPSDAALVERELCDSGLEFVARCVETEQEFLAALADFKPDLVLSDYSLPSFSGMDAVRLVQQRAPTLPLIIVTGSLNEETAAECIKAGAADYVLKTHLSRLPAAVRGTLERFRHEEDKRRSEETVRQSEERYRLLAENMSDVIWTMDLAGHLAYVSPSIARLCGFSVREMIGRSFDEWLAPSSATRVRNGIVEGIAKNREGGRAEARRIEVEVLCKDGSTVWCDVSANGTYSLAGQLIGIQGVTRDISERRRAKQARRRSERNYRSVFEQANDAIVIFEPESETIIDANPKACEMYGFPHDELVGMSMKALTKDVPRGEEQLRTLIKEGRYHGFETVHLARDGREINVLINSSLIESGGRPAVLSMNRDVTWRKRAEEDLQFRNLVLSTQQEASIDGILVVDEDANIVSCNHRFVEMWGIPPELIEKRADEPVLRFVANQVMDHGAFLQRVQYLFEHRRETGRDEVVLKDGRVFERYSAPMFGSDDRYYGRVWYFHDVTERQRAEQHLRESEERFRQLAETMPDAVVVGQDGKNVYANSAAARLLRAAVPEELVGLDISAIIDPAHREGAGQRMQRALAGERQPSFEDHFVRLDGSLLPVEIAVSLLTWQGRPGVQVVVRDITERKHAEDELRASEARYRQLFTSAMDGIGVADAETGILTDCNDALQALVGRSREELIGQPQAILHPPEPLRNGVTADFVRSGELLGDVVESKVITRDGVECDVEVKANVINLGGRRQLIGIFRDITERKRAEEAIRTSEQRYRSLFEQSPLGIYQTAPDGRILAANPALLRKLGYASLEELADRALEIDGFEPRDLRKEFKERIERDGEVLGFESGWLTKDGRVLAVRESARAVRDPDGKTLYYEGTIEDVTAERRAEEERRRLVAAVEQAAETIVITDTSGRIEYVNPAFESSTGYTREEARGQRPSMLKSNRQNDAYYAALWRAITRGETWKGHFINKRKDGSLYEEEATISPVRDGSGKTVNFVAVKRDVTREMALQTQLRQAQKIEAIGMLAGGVAHDFNNVLQALLSYTQLVRVRGGGPEGMFEALGQMDDQIRRGAALTRQLLLFSRRDAVRLERLDLNEVVQGSVRMLRRLVRENVTFELELGAERLPVEADHGQLDQVLLNLIVNASDAMPEGGRLTVRTWRAGAEWVWLEVRDTGHGIPDEIQDRIFEPFFTTREPGTGTGLGLAVVHGIVTQHGGKILMESRAGEGTTFRIGLPAARSGEVAAVEAAAATPLPHGRDERVLVVEDEPATRDALCGILTSLDYQVTGVGNGEEAGALPAEPAFDVVLSDLMLPGVGGAELASKLRDRWPGLKVILMSGYTENEAMRQDIRRGLLRFLQKPFDMNTLAREIRAALGES